MPQPNQSFKAQRRVRFKAAANAVCGLLLQSAAAAHSKTPG
jgi:hypothetical protein